MKKQQSIDTDLPIQTVGGNEVIIVDKIEAPDPRLIGVIKYGAGRCRYMKWDMTGRPTPEDTSYQPKAQIKNVPGYKSATVWLNVYEDQAGYSTGYGYPSEELAEQYAKEDNTSLPVVATTKTKIVFKEADEDSAHSR